MRLTPGALRLRYQQKFGHGLRVAWYRDVVRRRILSTPPITDSTDRRCEIHVFTSDEDWLNLVWTLKSFYIASGRRYALCIHEDGTVKESTITALREHFPAARVIRRAEADARLDEVLRNFPRCRAFRRSNLLAPKVFDFGACLDSDRMGLFDSDVLFFDEPTIFLGRVEDPKYLRNTLNADCGYAYTVDPDVVRPLLGHELQPYINSGFGLIHRDSINWEWIEEFLPLPGFWTDIFGG